MPPKQRFLKLKVLRCVRDMFKLGVPVVIARLGSLTLTMIGTIMVGRYSTDALAFQSLAAAIDTLLLMIVQGLLQGVIVLTANAYGEGHYHACGAILRRTIPYAMFIAFVCMCICLPAQTVMGLLGQPEDISEGAAKVLSLGAISLPFYVFFFVMVAFMEGTKRPLPGMIMIIIANIVNALSCYVFIYGHFGFPAMGAVGFAISLTLVRVVAAVGMFIFVFCVDEQDEFGVWITPEKNKEQGRKLRGIGYGAAVMAGVEEGAYSVVNILAGWLGAVALGAYTIMLNIINNSFMVATGVGTASSVLMGIAYGHKSVTDMRIIGTTALVINTTLLGIISIGLVLFPGPITSIYSTDAELIAKTIPLLMVCAAMTLFDGGQQLLVNLLRGAVDILIPTVFQAVAFGVVMLVLIWLLAFKMDMGVLGMAYAMLAACGCAFFLLLYRFYYLCRRLERDGFNVRL